MKYIEFVCTRNEGRSPVAELIGQWYLEKRGLDKKYSAKSSGSHRLAPDPNEVQSTSNDDVPFESLKKLVNLGIKHKIFSEKKLASIKKYVQKKDTEKLRPFFQIANKIFKDQERHFRADAVHRLAAENNIQGYLKAYSDQTAQRNDTVAIFAMSQNNTEKVKEIYAGAKNKPVIETLSVYATGDPKAKLPNAFAQGEKFYHDVIDQLFDQIPMAIDKFVKQDK